MSSHSEISIREATRADMRVVAEMMAESEAYLATLDGSRSNFDAPRARRKLERLGFGPTPLFSCAVIEAGAEVVGHAVYNIAFWADGLEGTVLLTDLFVKEAWRSRGLGQQMMSYLAAIGRDHGCESLMWTVWNINDRAMRFYRRLGAEPIADEVLMKWSLRLSE